MEITMQFTMMLEKAFARMEEMGLEKEAARSMALLLQKKLACSSKISPCADDLELIMRAVLAVMKREEEENKGDENWDRYTLSNLTSGVVGILYKLKAPPDIWEGYKW